MTKPKDFEPEFDEKIDFEADEELEEALGRGKQRLADAIENTATRIDDRLYGSAEYLRSTEIGAMRDDFVAAIRKRPLLSVGVALGAGYLIAKALNVGSGRGKRGRAVSSRIKRQIGKAVVGSLAAAVAARVRQSLADAQEREQRYE